MSCGLGFWIQWWCWVSHWYSIKCLLTLVTFQVMFPWICDVGKCVWRETSATEKNTFNTFHPVKSAFQKVFSVNFMNNRWSLGSLASKEAGSPREMYLSDVFPPEVSFQVILDPEGSRGSLCHCVCTSVTHWVCRVWHPLFKFFPWSVFQCEIEMNYSWMLESKYEPYFS